MDYAAASAFLDSDSDDDEDMDPPLVLPHFFPEFFEDDDDIDDSMVVLLGTAALYAASVPSRVRESDRAKIEEWYDELMSTDCDEFQKGMRLNRATFDFVLRQVTPFLATEQIGPGKPRIDIEKRVAATIWSFEQPD